MRDDASLLIIFASKSFASGETYAGVSRGRLVVVWRFYRCRSRCRLTLSRGKRTTGCFLVLCICCSDLASVGKGNMPNKRAATRQSDTKVSSWHLTVEGDTECPNVHFLGAERVAREQHFGGGVFFRTCKVPACLFFSHVVAQAKIDESNLSSFLVVENLKIDQNLPRKFEEDSEKILTFSNLISLWAKPCWCTLLRMRITKVAMCLTVFSLTGVKSEFSIHVKRSNPSARSSASHWIMLEVYVTS